MIDFLILYEHRAREYEGICLLKVALESKGYSVAIEQWTQVSLLKYLRRKYKPKVILTFALYDDFVFVPQVLSVGWNVHKVVNLQWEQITAQNSKAVEYHVPRETAVEAVHLCWGDECKIRLEKNHLKHPILTGAIHLDFLRPAFLSYYLSREAVRKQFGLPDGNMVLYISSFVQANMREEEIENLRKKLGDEYVKFIENVILSRKITLEWMDTLLKKDPDCYIIYRPHPGENLDFELQKRIDGGRFYVIPDLSVKQWILVADYIYTWISTAIVEAFFANKNCQIIRPLPIDIEYDMPLFYDANIIQTEDQFLSSYFKPDLPFPISRERIDHYYNISSEYSFQRIVRLLEEVYTTDQYDIKHYPIKLYFKAIARIVIRMIKKVILACRITPDSIFVRWIPALSKHLEFALYLCSKMNMELVPEAEAEEIENKLRDIVKSVENDSK